MIRVPLPAGRAGAAIVGAALLVLSLLPSGCAGSAIGRDSPVPVAGQPVTPPPSPELRVLRVELDDLEDNVTNYVGLTIGVSGVVQDILGPRIFTIDEPASTDTDREILVFVPRHRAALVRKGDRVTVTGVVKTFVRDDLAGEWGWPQNRAATDLESVLRPVFEAVRIVRGSDELALPARSTGAAAVPVGTSGTDPVTSISELAFTQARDAGRAVRLRDASIRSLSGGGFIVDTADSGIFVLPAHDVPRPRLRPGDRISLDGVLLQIPDHMRAAIGTPGGLYVLATRLAR